MIADEGRPPGVKNIDVVCVDDHAFGFGTFQSHNQKVVSNRNGIFMTHLKRYTALQWRLSRSTDGGKNFSTIYDATDETNVKHGTYLYWDIHTMQSGDGGETWQKMDGAPLALPVVSDSQGPTDRITLDDEYEFDTWLSSFMVKDGKLHFIYKYRAPGESARQHYVRYDLKTVRKDRDVWPVFEGDRISLSHFDGFFASRVSLAGSPLYCIMAQGGRIACLASDDNGDTWHDYAVSEKKVATSEKTTNPYAIGGCRELTADGWVIGSFTDRIPDPECVTDLTVPGSIAPVYFFRIQAGPARK